MNLLLYFLVVVVWGGTWIAIKYQVQEVSPVVAIFYRSAASAVILLGYIWIRRLRWRFGLREHRMMAMVGLFMFSLNYVFLYFSELYITSGLVALIFALTLPFNIINSAIFLRRRVRPASLVACAIALAGIVVVFWTDLTTLTLDNRELRGVLFAALAALCFSCGNVVSDRAQSVGMPIVQTETYGMVYGALFMVPVVLLTSGFQFSLDPKFVYSLGYLVIFGSIIAFGSYLTIIGRIGADRAGYITVLFPIVALLLSTFLEGYSWTVRAGVGAALVLAGCALSVRLPAGPARGADEPSRTGRPLVESSLTEPDSHRRPGARRR